MTLLNHACPFAGLVLRCGWGAPAKAASAPVARSWGNRLSIPVVGGEISCPDKKQEIQVPLQPMDRLPCMNSDW